MSNATGPLSAELLDQLRKIDTPTIANALELMDIRPRTEGFMRPEIKSVIPVADTVVGYAVTGVISARHRSPNALERRDYYEAIESIPAPRMVVLHDLDYPATIGSYWGEIQGNIALGLGCVGAVTDGGGSGPERSPRDGFSFLGEGNPCFSRIRSCRCLQRAGGRWRDLRSTGRPHRSRSARRHPDPGRCGETTSCNGASTCRTGSCGDWRSSIARRIGRLACRSLG